MDKILEPVTTSKGTSETAHVSIQFRIGAVAEEVRRAVLEWNADLIVTASYNPGFLGHLLGLERAPQIVKSAPCPVVVYHEAQGVPIDNNCGLELRED